MAPHPLSDQAYRRDMGDGLVLRWSTAADVDRIAELYSYVFRENAEAPLNHFVATWTRDMMSGQHPLITPQDFAVVEDTRSGAIVASTCLLRQTWEYAGVPFPIGRPEVVATHPDYRNRGLIRAIFELIHARSAARGHMVQAITGIPYYYRQFGYEFALDLGGERIVYFAAIPKLKAGQSEPYALRDATHEDLPWLMALYDAERTRSYQGAPMLVSTPIDEAYWRLMLQETNLPSGEWWRTQVIVNNEGRPLGYLMTSRRRWGENLPVFGMWVEPGVSLVAVLPSVLRGLQPQAPELLSLKPDEPPVDRILFALGRVHPVYDALGEELAPRYEPPYAWYVRVPDLPALLRHLAPALERRLAGSIMAGHSGELKVDFYRGGLRLAFEHGRLVAVEEWRAQVWGDRPKAGFPPLVFLQLLFGRRSLAELRHAFPDVWAEQQEARLLESLFPPQPSSVTPLG